MSFVLDIHADLPLVTRDRRIQSVGIKTVW